MSTTVYRLALCAMLLALSSSATAQQPKKVPRIGYLDAFSSSVTAERVGSFVQGLRDLGYIEGKNIEIYDHLEKVVDRFDDVANEISGVIIENV